MMAMLWAQEVFAPLRGWYNHVEPDEEEDYVFAPLRGWYCLSVDNLLSAKRFRPLTGMVLSLCLSSKRKCRFRPLTGMVPIYNGTKFAQSVFSPPYGDGTKSF